MKNKSTMKIVINILILVAIVGIVFYVVDNSLGEIFGQLMETSWYVVVMVIVFGLLYQIVEGRSIREIAEPFQSDFSTKDGFFTSCYVAFYRVISFGTGTLVSEVLFYKKKGMSVSQGIGVTALHMIMYKLAVIFLSTIGLIIQFSHFYSSSPKMIPFIIAGVIVTFLIIFVLLVLSSSIRLQVMLTVWANKLFKRQKLRDWVDQCNIQIYSLRETVQTVTKNPAVMVRIFFWNVSKVLLWLVIPYIVLVEHHPSIDFLLVLSFTCFAIILSGIIPTPAGIGPFEFVYLLLFKPLVGTVDAVASVLLYRFGSFVLPFIIGMIFVLVEKRKEIKVELQAVKEEHSQE